MVYTKYLTIYDNTRLKVNHNQHRPSSSVSFNLDNNTQNESQTDHRDYTGSAFDNQRDIDQGITSRTILKVNASPVRSDQGYYCNGNSPYSSPIASFRYHGNNKDASLPTRNNCRHQHSKSTANVSYDHHSVEIPIERVYLNKSTDKLNHARTTPGTIDRKRSDSPHLQLELEINTPKSDIKISRKCKSYEVS